MGRLFITYTGTPLERGPIKRDVRCSAGLTWIPFFSLKFYLLSMKRTSRWQARRAGETHDTHA